MRRLSAALLAAVLAAVPPAHALQMSSWVTYQSKRALRTEGYGRDFTSICVFAYDFDPHDNLRPAEPWVDHQLDLLMRNKRPGRPVFITVVNDVETVPPLNHHGETVLRVLSDPAKRAEHIRQLAVLSERADGLEIDYEGLLVGTRPHFTQFIAELRAALPPGKLLSVVCQPKVNDLDGPRGNAIDWVAIHPHVDILKVMTYYWSYAGTPPGASAPLEQTRQVVQLAKAQVPLEKLHIVLTHFGWDWPEGQPGTFVHYERAMEILTTRPSVSFRDPDTQSLRINYVDGGFHQIWLPDATALRAQADIVLAEGIDKIDVWELGVGDPEFWSWATGGAPEYGDNPVPVLASMTPTAAVAGGPAFQLTVRGAGFANGAAVLWNGAPLTTTYGDESTLTAQVPPEVFTAEGTAQVSVFNPAPGGGASDALTFTLVKGYVPPTPVPSAFPPPTDQPRSLPNPWRADMHGGFPVTFENLPAGARIEIYTLSSQEVKTLQATGPAAAWDLTDEDGEPVPPGYYVYVVSGPQGSTRGKTVVIR